MMCGLAIITRNMGFSAECFGTKLRRSFSMKSTTEEIARKLEFLSQKSREGQGWRRTQRGELVSESRRARRATRANDHGLLC